MWSRLSRTCSRIRRGRTAYEGLRDRKDEYLGVLLDYQ